MTVRLAYMHPSTSQRSGRRHFRGRDSFGNIFWLMEQKGSAGAQWILSIDLAGSTAEPEPRPPKATETDLRNMLTGRRMLTIGRIEEDR